MFTITQRNIFYYRNEWYGKIELRGLAPMQALDSSRSCGQIHRLGECALHRQPRVLLP
ncbi:hypothetical protein RchiOBHm_Chr7g0204311 [Rosa chinensis]|uniref:Uncharacterized protein n=1 Tax=Rosa chinensis TaxID=74649 RepID=A0A2P6P8P2_ROSCH|nr:hypothetical protein RchiOBHm_Chr7g0204311 [Rosa chinensis]